MKSLLGIAILSTVFLAEEPYYNSLFDCFPQRDYKPIYINPKLLEKVPKVMPAPHRKKPKIYYT